MCTRSVPRGGIHEGATNGTTSGQQQITVGRRVSSYRARVEIDTFLVQDLRTLGRPDRIESDVLQERFVEHTLQIAIQAALEVASHIVSDQRLGEPQTNRELFELLTRAGWLPEDLGETCEQMAGLRNILAHGYRTVDLAVLGDIIENRLDDVLALVQAIRGRLGG